MSMTNPAASRLLCRSLAAAPAKTSSHAAAASCSASRASSSQPRQQQRREQRSHFHTSAPLAGRKRSPFLSIRADKMGLVTKPEAVKKLEHEISPAYDDTDIETLKKTYTPEQLDAIIAGEQSIRSRDFVLQGRVRNDPYRFRYLDDFATVRPIVDKRPKSGRPVDTSARFMTPDEFGDDLLEHYREISEGPEEPFGVDPRQALNIYEDMRSRMLNKEPGEELTQEELFRSVDKVLGPTDPIPGFEEDAESLHNKGGFNTMTEMDMTKEEHQMTEEEKTVMVEETEAMSRDQELEFYKFMMERNSMTGFDGGDTALAPDVPDKVPGVAGLYKQQMSQEEEELDPEGKFQDLKRQTGMSIRSIINMYQMNTKGLVLRWVSNQTRLGKIRSTYYLAAAGNGNGWLGLGVAKSVDKGVAEAKAKLAAIRNMRPVRRYENRTIYGNVEGKSGATVVQLFARPPGFGLRVSHRIFEMARLAGIHDLSARMPRSRNPMNSVKACYEALTNQPDPETIAIGRGKKLVDARKVYHGGAVY